MFNISTLLKSILLSAILFVAFWIRIQSTTAIPEGHFTGVDAYTYYFQAQQISDLGKLPERDMHRWMPLGRDNGQTLNLYSYVLAYAYKALVLVFPSVTLYHVALYMPPVCFCIGLGAFCLFLYHTYGLLFSSVVGVLLTTLPGAINRSTAGFSDRDAWCLMLGLLAVVTYLASLQIETSRKRLIWTLTSGLIVFLGGLSWEGFGVFLSVILIVELYRFLASETEEGLGHCALWGAKDNNILFCLAVGATAMTLMFMAWRLDFHPKNELAFVAAISWFLIWTSLSRDAERYSSFTSLVLAFFTAELIQFCSIKLSDAFRRYLPWNVIKVGTAMILLATFMWIPFPYGYAQNILPATHARRSNPIHSTVAEIFQWMKAELPNTAVVAGDWIHGSQLNVLGGVKTITGTDTFIQHWIHLYYRYLFCGQSEKEALEFLKSHEATHLMLTEVDIVGEASVYSVIGSHSEQDQPFEIIELRETIREKEHLFVFPEKETPFFKYIQIDMHPENNAPLSAITVHHNTRATPIPYVAFYNKERSASRHQDGSKTGGILLYFDEQQKFQRCYYVPPIAWDNFAIRLFLRGIPSDAFKPVYETQTPLVRSHPWTCHRPRSCQRLNPRNVVEGISCDPRLPGRLYLLLVGVSDC